MHKMYNKPEFVGLWRLAQNRWTVVVSTATDGSLIYRPLGDDGRLSNSPRAVSELPEGGWEVAKFADQYIKDVKVTNR